MLHKYKFRITASVLLIILLSVSFCFLLNAATPETTLDIDRDKKLSKSDTDIIEDYYLGKTSNLGLYDPIMPNEFGIVDLRDYDPNPWNLPWWDNFPRFSNSGSNFDKTSNMLATVACDTYGLNDALFTRFFMDHNFRTGEASQVARYNSADIIPGGCLELIGNASLVLVGLHRNEDGSFLLDAETGNARIISHHWAWPHNGNDPLINYCRYVGIDAYVNKLPFYGKYISNMTISEPKYPDGTSALGYFNSDEDPRPNNCALSGGFNGSRPADPSNVFGRGEEDPRNAKLYDALAAKDINGTLQYNIGGEASNGTDDPRLIHYFDSNGTEVRTGNLGFHKDVSGAAADWWIQYYNETFEDLIRKGARFFWVDNYNGYDYCSWESIRNGFGEYSVASFRDYLKANPQVVTANVPTNLNPTPWIVNGKSTINPNDPDNFDIRHYLKALFVIEYPHLNPNAEIYSAGMPNAWQSDFFLDDPIWMAYMAFKFDNSERFANMFHDAMRDAAIRCGVDPEECAIGGNDVGRLAMGGLNGTEMEMIHTEYTSVYSLQTSLKADNIPPYGGSAPFYKTIAQHERSRHGAVWYYNDWYEQYEKNYEMNVIIGMEALANNALLNWGENLHVFGTAASARKVHETIRDFTPLISGRERGSSTAVLYSYDSMSAYNTPNRIGFIGEIQPALDFSGICHAFEQLNIPYNVIYDFKLTEDVLDDVEYLILPSITFCDDNVINLIVNYVKNGGHVAFSGNNSGENHGRREGFVKRTEPKLYNQLMSLVSTGRVFFYDWTQSKDFLSYKETNPTHSKTYYPYFTQLANKFSANGISPEYRLEYSTGRLRSALHYNPYNNTAMVDLVNFDLVRDTDILTNSSGAAIYFKPLKKMGALQDIIAVVYDMNAIGTKTTAVLQSDGYYKVIVPSFRYYTTINFIPVY